MPHGQEKKKKPQNIKQKQYCTKFKKDSKNGPHTKKKKKILKKGLKYENNVSPDNSNRQKLNYRKEPNVSIKKINNT